MIQKLLGNIKQPAIMGIINASPNSFHRPVKSLDDALYLSENMIHSGVDIIDVGGEATGPYVNLLEDSPSIQEEIDRVIPIAEAISSRFDVLVSVDTSRADVMSAALVAGAGMINDQRALRQPGALDVAVSSNAIICLMHFFADLQRPNFESLDAFLEHVKNDLRASVQSCEVAGIDRERLCIDPGFGQGNYAKNIQENYYLLSNLDRFHDLGLPLLVGWSRKSMIGDVLDAPPEDRLYGSIAAAVIAAMKGVAILRVHDVQETVQAIRIFQATACHF